jgi:hypothetical protein
MKDQFLADIFVPNHSSGLINDANVLKAAIGSEITRVIVYPFRASTASLADNNSLLEFKPKSKVAIFIERLFEHQELRNYSRRVLIPNMEWLNDRDSIAAKNLVTDFWHKSKFGLAVLREIYPDKQHFYTGFTSPELKSTGLNYDSFAHFAGKSKTRHTQDILDIWLTNTVLPPLTLQAYGLGISLPVWFRVTENLSVYLGPLAQQEYEREFTRHGVHICTSQMEGFGHYINEARSIGALVLALDAPPMNELIDSESGVLVPVIKREQHLRGFRYFASPDAIKQRILSIVEMVPHQRATLGENARKRFEKEAELFNKTVRSIIDGFH